MRYLTHLASARQESQRVLSDPLGALPGDNQEDVLVQTLAQKVPAQALLRFLDTPYSTGLTEMEPPFHFLGDLFSDLALCFRHLSSWPIKKYGDSPSKIGPTDSLVPKDCFLVSSHSVHEVSLGVRAVSGIRGCACLPVLRPGGVHGANRDQPDRTF